MSEERGVTEQLGTAFRSTRKHAGRIAGTVVQSFPMRVWRHFLVNNGLVLSAGVSYQALFALFAAVYIAFASIGVWVGADERAIEGLMYLIDAYVPNLISEDGVIRPDQVTEVVRDARGTLSVTGLIAVVVLLWTAVSSVSYARRAVRDIYGFPAALESFAMLKPRDILAAVVFSVLLVVGAVLSASGTWALELVLSLFDADNTEIGRALVTLGTTAVVFIIDALALWALLAALAGADIPWRRAVPASLIGAVGMVVLQVGAGVLLTSTPANALLRTFALFVGLLVWCRLMGVVMLLSAAWVAVATRDRDITIVPLTGEQRRARAQWTDIVNARRELDRAEAAHADAPWFRKAATARHSRNVRAQLVALLEDEQAELWERAHLDAERQRE